MYLFHFTGTACSVSKSNVYTTKDSKLAAVTTVIVEFTVEKCAEVSYPIYYRRLPILDCHARARWERCIYQASLPSQGTVNGGGVPSLNDLAVDGT